jgi:tRNA(Ile)-lysidine synthase
MLDQLLHASPNAQIALLHERQTLRLYRGQLSIDQGGPPRATFKALTWRGEDHIDVPEWHGTLRFIAKAEEGFDAMALREGPLALRERRGGERLRTRLDGPSRTLKNLYQEAGIAAWQRGRLPLVYLGDRLLFAAGLGPNASAMITAAVGTELVRLDWEPYG